MNEQIWKLQRPLFASDGNLTVVMAYTEDREQTAMVPMPTEDIDLLFGDEPKVYVLAHIANGNLVLHERTEDQAW